VDQLRAALRLKPGSSETRFNLAVALNQQERWSEAADLFSQVMGSHAQDANTHYQFALALDHSKKTRAAMSEYASALLLQPDSPNALDGLAWILSTDPNPEFRNGSEAVKMAYHACELTSRNDPAKLKTLAAAYAETADFAAAANAAAAAQKLAGKLNRPELATECGQMLEQFKHAASWRR
jgi:cytochrome c-type biogenesis protein CcmH/NrfG